MTATEEGPAQAFLDESEDLDRLVADLPDAGWARSTPSPGWTITHQIAHLAWTDEVAFLAVTDPLAFGMVAIEAGADPLGYVDRVTEAAAVPPIADLVARWRAGRTALALALALALGKVDDAVAVPWFGPSMRPRSLAAARLMEVWAHGQDVADALGVRRRPTHRLREICDLGVRTRNFAYRINGLEPPADLFHIQLAAPDGSTWTWGPKDALGSVSGDAEDFCLVVTQRRDVQNTDLVAEQEAARWLTFAQAFAGPPKSASKRERA